MAPLNEEQLIQIRDERREQILAAALSVFSRRGVAGTKMSMIVKEAGISHGLVYHYFKSKEELFVTLVKRAIKGAQEALSLVTSLQGTAYDKIRKLVEEMMDEEGAPYFQLIYQARMSDGVPDKARILINQYTLDDYVSILRPLFEEGQRDGTITPGDPGELIAGFLTVLTGVMMVGLVDERQFRIPDIEMLMRMISK
ncbi:TetR family transcriptional regulator [Bacillus cereus]|uniref:TetR/AcrR family transcriptional regulator n=1 Tax=Bacillus nitratireducens TaxID=2026193 RepID=UPI000BEE6120|nr:TetR/AcrR family transcriptional regulator [Bacillus nitratireducens]PEA23652.1 TetR family transcriptional regulator [Bacillus cereus]PEB79512.1 TetR family transcriptional regulator [Bacillus cereus]PER23635.1 TetR family transcriptional regulator [Bacillus cereus]PEY94503.1 TetR family transcriptional regulator [Bacillus cereus]PFK27615.1 TetR family transcriptional regulator [Bacillus cereus]